MNLILLRHARTPGNELRRYIGATDEELSPAGMQEAAVLAGAFTDVERVYASPLKRCILTAQLVFPGVALNVLCGLSETNFGEFENKSAEDLAGNPEYQRWIDSMGTLPFPGGESAEAVRERVMSDFAVLLREVREMQKAAAVVHGGTIMHIMSELATPARSFYDWQVGNCKGYLVRVSEKLTLQLLEEIN